MSMEFMSEVRGVMAHYPGVETFHPLGVDWQGDFVDGLTEVAAFSEDLKKLCDEDLDNLDECNPQAMGDIDLAESQIKFKYIHLPPPEVSSKAEDVGLSPTESTESQRTLSERGYLPIRTPPKRLRRIEKLPKSIVALRMKRLTKTLRMIRKSTLKPPGEEAAESAEVSALPEQRRRVANLPDSSSLRRTGYLHPKKHWCARNISSWTNHPSNSLHPIHA